MIGEDYSLPYFHEVYSSVNPIFSVSFFHYDVLIYLLTDFFNYIDISIYYIFSGGEARRNGHLTVQFRPTFENMPRIPIWSWNQRPANLSCTAESIPNATIKWRYVVKIKRKDSILQPFNSS